jgi:hypothetical protein
VYAVVWAAADLNWRENLFPDLLASNRPLNRPLRRPNLIAPIAPVASIPIGMRSLGTEGTEGTDAIAIARDLGDVGKSAGNIAIAGSRMSGMSPQSRHPCQKPL